MSYEDWLEESKSMGIMPPKESGGFDTWKQQSQKMGLLPPQENYSTEEVDFAYDQYRRTADKGVKIFTRESFEKRGQATEWIKGGATRTPRSHIENLKESYSRGKENFTVNQQYYEASMAGDTAKADKLYEQWKKSKARDTLDPIGVDGNLLAKASYGAANIMPGMLEGTRQAVPTMIGGTLMGAAAGGVGAPVGLAVGLKAGTTLAWYKQGTGAMQLSMREKGIKKNVADMVARVAGIPYALIEQLQVDHLIPGVRQAATKAINKSMLRIAAHVAKKYGMTLGMETTEEVAQEAVGMIAEDLAGLFSGMGMDVSVEELKEKGWKLWNTAKQSATAMALLPIPGAAVDFHAGIKGKRLMGKFEDAGYNSKQAKSMASKVDEGITPMIAHRQVIDETIADTHNKSKGSVVSKQTGRSLTQGFPVDTGTEVVIEGEVITPDQITEFQVEHAQELAAPNAQVNTWYDKESNQSHIDIVQVAKTQAEAMELGLRNNQSSVFNLETGETIPVQHEVMGFEEWSQSQAQALEGMSKKKRSQSYDLYTQGAQMQNEQRIARLAMDERKRIMSIQLDEETDSTAKEYGLTSHDAQQKLDNAEVRYRKLSETRAKRDLTFMQEKELKFLSKNRKNLVSLLDRDTAPIEGKVLTKKEVMNRVHNLSDLLGYDIVKRRAIQKRITGKESLTQMVPAQREQVMMFLEREAKEQGANIEGIDTTPVGELMAKMRERVQKPALTRRDRRTMTTMRKALYDIKRGVSFYFLNNSRVRRITRALDNYEEDGPFTRYIFRAVRNAESKAVSNFTSVMESMKGSFEQQGIDIDSMMLEVKDIGIKDKLTTAERIGVYALSKNEKTANHLLASLEQSEIDKVVKSVEETPAEMAVVAEITGYFEHGWYEFEAIAKATGVKGLVKEDNYITAFVMDKDGLDSPDFLEGLTQQLGEGKHVPGEERAIARKPRARRQLELNVFVIHARATKSIERFKAMAPVATKVGSILNHRGFKNNLNNVTYGHGSKLMSRWLQDSVRGKAAYDSSAFAPMLKWLRTSSMNYVVGFKILLAGKQGVSSLQGMLASPKMIPLVIANLTKGATPANFAKMQAEVKGKSTLMKTRDWNRDLRAAWDKKSVRKFYQGKKLSPISMRFAMNIDQHTTTAVWYSAYQLSQSEGMNEKESVQFADGVVQDTQPMANAVDLPTYFRGSEFEKTLTIFQNQVNQNGQMLWYNIFGERKAKNINNTQMAYRLMVSQIMPALLLGMISRGRPPESAGEIMKDMAAHLLSPFVFLGRLAYNVLAGDWGPSNNIATTPMLETGRLASAIKRGDPKKIAKYGARTIGAWSGGRVPLQAVTTAEGAWNLATGETEDFRELVWSKYALKSKKKSNETPGVKY